LETVMTETPRSRAMSFKVTAIFEFTIFDVGGGPAVTTFKNAKNRFVFNKTWVVDN